MRHLPVLRLLALVRGWPGRSRSRSRPKVRVAMAVATLFALALMGLTSAGSAARAATEGPYGGTAAAVPGTVHAENYDTGGQGVAYNVTSVNGTANSYRSDGVDLEATTDTGGRATTWAGPRPGSGSSTPSTSRRRAPTPSGCGWPRPPRSPTPCTSTTAPGPT